MRLDPETLEPTQEPLELFGNNSLRVATNAQKYAVYAGTTGQENKIGLENEAVRFLVTEGTNHPCLTWPCGRVIEKWEVTKVLKGETN